MKNKYILLLVTILMTVFTAKAQERTDAMLFGDVRCEGEHIPYVTVLVKGTGMGTVADESGHFKLANLPVGKAIIQFKCVGFKTKEVEVNMKRGGATEIFADIEKDNMLLQQVVVTGTRSEHFIKDVPIRTEVITSKDIENKNAANIYEALENVSGIRVEQQCQYCNFSMLRMQGLGAEHTQILINGQPIYSGLVGVYGLQQISTEEIDRIEIIKGAGSALYGSSAVAGAINIITKEPSYIPNIKAGVQFGKHGTNKYNVSASIRNEKGNMGLNIFAQKYVGDAIDETAEGVSKDAVDKKDGISDMVAFNLNNAGFGFYAYNVLSKEDKLTVRGRYMYELRNGGTMTDDYYKNPLTDGTENIITDRYESELNYMLPLSKNTKMNFSLAYANHSRNATNDSYLGDYMATHEDKVPDLREMRPYLADEDMLTATLTLSSQLNTHHLMFGLQANSNKLEESGMYVVVDEENVDYYGTSYKSISEKKAKEFGIFVQDEWSISPKFTAVPGVRLDFHSSEEEYKANKKVSDKSLFPKTDFDETSFSPRLALKYEMTDRITLRANAGTGFRAPYGFSEDLHLCSGSPRVWKSSDLKPEKSVSYNLSADYYGAKMKLGLNIFRTNLKDKIAFTDASDKTAALGYDYEWHNVDDAFVQGVEFSLMANIVKNLDAGLDFTYNQGEYDNARADWKNTKYEGDSKYISRFPTTTGRLKIEYAPKDWVFSFTSNYTGKMYIDYFSEVDANSLIRETDPFVLCNAKVSKDINGFRLYAGVNNIFNYIQEEKYLDDAAFMYAPTYGTMYYFGLSINLRK